MVSSFDHLDNSTSKPQGWCPAGFHDTKSSWVVNPLNAHLEPVVMSMDEPAKMDDIIEVILQKSSKKQRMSLLFMALLKIIQDLIVCVPVCLGQDPDPRSVLRPKQEETL